MKASTSWFFSGRLIIGPCRSAPASFVNKPTRFPSYGFPKARATAVGEVNTSPTCVESNERMMSLSRSNSFCHENLSATILARSRKSFSASSPPEFRIVLGALPIHFGLQLCSRLRLYDSCLGFPDSFALGKKRKAP